MPPLPKFQKEEIIKATMQLTRERGFEAITVRDIAALLGVSTKPIYTVFKSMDELREALLIATNEYYQSFVFERMAQYDYPPYKCMGLSYIAFAREERELFRLLFMRNSDKDGMLDDSTYTEAIESIINGLDLDRSSAELFHCEMWIFVHGIAVMSATGYLEWDEDTISHMISDVYAGLVHKHTTEKERM